MQHRDSRSAVSGTAALKLDARVSSAHIIQFPGSEYSARQIDDTSSCHPAGESRRSNARIRQSGDFRQPYQAGPRAPCSRCLPSSLEFYESLPIRTSAKGNILCHDLVHSFVTMYKPLYLVC